jgi:hypothetical protein
LGKKRQGDKKGKSLEWQKEAKASNMSHKLDKIRLTGSNTLFCLKIKKEKKRVWIYQPMHPKPLP